MSRTEPSDLVERGRRVLALEADAIGRVAQRLGPAFAAAVRLLAFIVFSCYCTGGYRSSAMGFLRNFVGFEVID